MTIVYDGHVLNTVDSGDTETNSATVYGNTIDRILVEPPATAPAPGSFDVTAGPATADVDIIEPELTIDKDVVGQVGDSDTRRALPNETLTYQLTIANTATRRRTTSSSLTWSIAGCSPTRSSTAQTAASPGPSPTPIPSDGDLGWFVRDRSRRRPRSRSHTTSTFGTPTRR